MRRVFLPISAAWIVLTGIALCSPPTAYTANAQEDWRMEFDDICSKTADVMTLKQPELKSLIERCDRLKPRLEKLDESAAKVYLKRLRMCRDLYVFVLESSSP